MSSAFEITARKCKALGWGIVLSCRTCRVVRDFNVSALLKHGRGDEDLERRFIEGKMRCSKCRTPSDWMRVSQVAPGSLQEAVVATWVRRGDKETERQDPADTPCPSLGPGRPAADRA